MANSCALTSLDNYWSSDGISLDILTYCVFISSGQAAALDPCAALARDKCCFVRVFPLSAAVHSLLDLHCSLHLALCVGIVCMLL